jgi:hypothetical protein
MERTSSRERGLERPITGTVATVINSTPRQIPDRPAGPNALAGKLDTPLTIGKRFKGKVAAADSVVVTFQTTGDVSGAPMTLTSS